MIIGNIILCSCDIEDGSAPIGEQSIHKQFVKIYPNNMSSFQRTVLRFPLSSIFSQPPLFVVCDHHLDILVKQLEEIGVKNYFVILQSRYCGEIFSLFLALQYLENIIYMNESYKVMCMMADQFIQDDRSFLNSISYIINNKNANNLLNENLLILGAMSNSINNEHGYIQVNGDMIGTKLYIANQFLETPISESIINEIRNNINDLKNGSFKENGMKKRGTKPHKKNLYIANLGIYISSVRNLHRIISEMFNEEIRMFLPNYFSKQQLSNSSAIFHRVNISDKFIKNMNMKKYEYKKYSLKSLHKTNRILACDLGINELNSHHWNDEFEKYNPPFDSEYSNINDKNNNEITDSFEITFSDNKIEGYNDLEKNIPRSKKENELLRSKIHFPKNIEIKKTEDFYSFVDNIRIVSSNEVINIRNKDVTIIGLNEVVVLDVNNSIIVMKLSYWNQVKEVKEKNLTKSEIILALQDIFSGVDSVTIESLSEMIKYIKT